MTIYNAVTITPRRGTNSTYKPPLCGIYYLELFVKQQLHHQLSDGEHRGRQTEQGEQVVENHDLEVGQH